MSRVCAFQGGLWVEGCRGTSQDETEQVCSLHVNENRRTRGPDAHVGFRMLKFTISRMWWGSVAVIKQACPGGQRESSGKTRVTDRETHIYIPIGSKRSGIMPSLLLSRESRRCTHLVIPWSAVPHTTCIPIRTETKTHTIP